MLAAVENECKPEVTWEHFLFDLQNPSGLLRQCLSVMYVLFVWRKALCIILSHNFSSSAVVSTTFVFSLEHCSFPDYGFQKVAAFRGLIVKVGRFLKQLQLSVILGSNQLTLTFGRVSAGTHITLQRPLRVSSSTPAMFHSCIPLFREHLRPTVVLPFLLFLPYVGLLSTHMDTIAS